MRIKLEVLLKYTFYTILNDAPRCCEATYFRVYLSILTKDISQCACL